MLKLGIFETYSFKTIFLSNYFNSDFLSDRVMAIHSIIGLDEQNGVKKFELFPNVKM